MTREISWSGASFTRYEGRWRVTHPPGITEAFDRGVVAGGEAVGVEVTVGVVVLGPAVVAVVDDVGADDEEVGEADATVATATVVTTTSALEKARTITARLRRRLDDGARTAAMRSCPQ